MKIDQVPGTPPIGYKTRGYAIGIAKRRHLDVHSSRFTSGPVQMVDGTWGYWTAHGVGLDGRVLQLGGRCMHGADWARSERGGVLDARLPVIYMS